MDELFEFVHFFFVPRVGLEPTRLSTKHFECSASAISPSRPTQLFNDTPTHSAILIPMSETTAKKVLVAEDEALIRMDIVETLRDSGYEVVGEAGDGQEAVELVDELQPDLVVMDIKMPRMDGITAAKHMAEKRIPVVLLTAFSQKELFEQAAQVGAMAYVVKPFNPNDLLPAIEIALHRHAELKALEGEIADLNERLETRKLVERAKGLLLAKKLVPDEPEAFRWIQKASMDRRLTMKDVAKTIVEQLADKT